MPQPAIQAVNLAKRFPAAAGELEIFSGLNLCVAPAERVAVTGESGAGKSTLLHILGGLDSASAGSVLVDGADITRMSEPELAAFRGRSIGFVWQLNTLLPEFTALENVMLPLLIRGDDRRNAAAAARVRLDEVELLPRATHRSGELSGGEQQRVALARALVTDPRILLADEPTGSLDMKTGAKVMALVEQVQERRGMALVLVTHNLAFAARCHSVVKLEGGVLTPGPVPEGAQ